MSHLNILNISREIENINKNISVFHKQISDIEDKNNRHTEIISDIEEIKINKLDVICSLEKIKDDFKFLESKLNSVDNCVKKLVNRNLDYVGKNKETFYTFLKELKVEDKKINVILYILDCSNVQDFLVVSPEELNEFGFGQSEISFISRKCREELETIVNSDIEM